MSKFIDRTGQTYGQLTVLRFTRKNERLQAFWMCRCSCGNEKEIFGGNLHSGSARSCGCLKLAGNNLRHGHSRNGKQSAEYICWVSMRGRVLNPGNDRFEDYGGRGITICKRWDDFENFLADMGPKPSAAMSIDRIEVNGNYEPGNCQWGTKEEQARNKRNSALITFNDETLCVATWSERLGIPYATLHARLQVWPVEKAFTTPVRKITKCAS
jgi:hypothetical protein